MFRADLEVRVETKPGHDVIASLDYRNGWLILVDIAEGATVAEQILAI